MAGILTSFRLTGASFKLVMQYPIVLLLPLFTLAAVAALVIAPVSWLIWYAENNPDGFVDFWKNLYFVTYNAAQNGDWELAVTSAIVETYILWAIWLTLALTAVLYFVTVGMHVATTQIRNKNPSLKEGFAVANRNFGRILLLALFNATILTWVKYFLRYTIGVVPFVGRWIMRGVRLVLTAVSYLMLPIIIYERVGPMNAFRSAWSNVKKTWAGLLVGTGFAFFALFLLFEVFAWGLLQGTLGVKPWVSLMASVIMAGVLFAVASSVAAALRAVLYWYATTGEVPEGFDRSDLPTVSHHGPITGPVAVLGLAATPVAMPVPQAAAPRGAGRARAVPATAPPASGGTTQRLACPRCHTVIVVGFGQTPVCPTCGYGKQ